LNCCFLLQHIQIILFQYLSNVSMTTCIPCCHVLEPESNCYKIVKMILERKFAPVIVFSFSKKDCEAYAMQMTKLDFNTDEEKALVQEVFNNAIDALSDDDKKLPQVMDQHRSHFCKDTSHSFHIKFSNPFEPTFSYGFILRKIVFVKKKLLKKRTH